MEVCAASGAVLQRGQQRRVPDRHIWSEQPVRDGLVPPPQPSLELEKQLYRVEPLLHVEEFGARWGAHRARDVLAQRTHVVLGCPLGRRREQTIEDEGDRLCAAWLVKVGEVLLVTFVAHRVEVGRVAHKLAEESVQAHGLDDTHHRRFQS